MINETRMIDVAGKRTQVLVGGEGPPLLYLHSAGSETFWLPFHQGLAQHFTVYAPAHPGFAESEGLEEIDTIEDLVFHYWDLFDLMGWEKVNIVGASLGGWIAAEFAVRYPEKVDRLVLVGSAGLWVDDAPIADLFASLLSPERLRSMIFHDPNSFLAQLLLPAQPSPEQMLLSFKAMQAAARVGWNPFMHNPKLRRRLYRIKSPTLILWGESDKLIPLAHAHAYHEGIKNSQMVILKQCGHLPMFEKTEEFVKAVVGFLRS